MHKVVLIGIGSNLGNREENIRRAINLVREKCNILDFSSIYETEPIGYKEQYPFLNCVVKVETDLEPKELLDFILSIEKRLGRARTFKNAPRTIDLDILFYDNIVMNHYGLIIPHPRLHERAFVLEPLKEISGTLIHPALKKSIDKIYKNLNSKEWIRLYIPKNEFIIENDS